MSRTEVTWDPQVRTMTPGALVRVVRLAGLSFQEPLNGPRVGEVPFLFPSPGPCSPGRISLTSPQFTSIRATWHLQRWMWGVQNVGHGWPAFTVFRNV